MGQNKKLVVIDYNMGNVKSVSKAFDLIGCRVVVSNKEEAIKKADYLILPGVGAYSEGMKNLKKFGLVEILNEEVVKNKKLILGICLGMQLMAKQSEEFGKHQGLGWFDAEVRKFRLSTEYKIPHVGWNNINFSKDCPLFNGLKEDPVFYFVHGYHMICNNPDVIMATCDYGGDFTAAIQKGNIFATQFHPEKSQTVGLKLLKNFINLQED